MKDLNYENAKIYGGSLKLSRVRNKGVWTSGCHFAREVGLGFVESHRTQQYLCNEIKKLIKSRVDQFGLREVHFLYSSSSYGSSGSIVSLL